MPMLTCKTYRNNDPDNCTFTRPATGLLTFPQLQPWVNLRNHNEQQQLIQCAHALGSKTCIQILTKTPVNRKDPMWFLRSCESSPDILWEFVWYPPRVHLISCESYLISSEISSRILWEFISYPVSSHFKQSCIQAQGRSSQAPQRLPGAMVISLSDLSVTHANALQG